MTAPLPPGFLARPFAHRGLHNRAAGRIENSPSAFAAAIEAGCGIELDVQLTADGLAVVFHDSSLERLTQVSGAVSAMTQAELTNLRLTDGPETIPTLAAALSQVAGRVPLLIELKDQSGDLSGSDGRLESAVAADLSDYRGPVALMSFNPDMVACLAPLVPDTPRGLTTDAFDPASWTAVPEARLAQLRRIDTGASGASFVSHDHRDLGAPRISALRAEGLPLLTWTIRTPAEEVAALRVAQAITFEGYSPASLALSG